MEKVVKRSQPFGHAKRSVASNGFNGWKATTDNNGTAMDFGDTSIGLGGMAMVLIGRLPLHKQPIACYRNIVQVYN